MPNVQFVKISSTKWELRVANAVLGIIYIDRGLFGNKETYFARSSFTVAGEGTRRFGGEFNTLELAKEKLTNLMFDLYDEMKEAFERPRDLGSEEFDPHNV